jgi:hypothetical protein
MIYTDLVHIITDGSLDELHEFAKSAGIHPCWFHRGSKFPHYDLPKKRRGKPLAGAIQKTSRELIEILKAS